MIIEILLLVYVGFWLWKEYRPMTPKRYFKRQLRDLKMQVWDTEFKRFKIKEAREELRSDYDVSKSRLETLRLEMKVNDEKKDDDPKKLNKDERARLSDQEDRLKIEIARKEKGREEGDPGAYVLNLKDFDDQIAVLNSQVEQLRSLSLLTRDYSKKQL